MSRRTLADWQTINDEYEASRLSVTEFCRDHDFSPKYFYAVRSKLKQKQQPKSFVKIEREQRECQLISRHQLSTSVSKVMHFAGH